MTTRLTFLEHLSGLPLMIRPSVSVHFAQSLDGRIAFSDRRTQLSSPEGVVLAHRARAEHDGVLVGSGTLRVDNPRLTVRECPGRSPRRIVLASTLNVPEGAWLLAPGPGVLVVGVAGRACPGEIARLRASGAEVRLVAPQEDGLVSLPEALAAIHAWGVERLLVEGGARVLTGLFRARLVDRVSVEIVPRWLGTPGLAALGDLGIRTDREAPALVDARVVQAGPGLLLTGRLEWRAEP